MSTNRTFAGTGPILAAVALSAAMLLAGCQGNGDAKAGEAEEKGPDAIPVEVAKVERRAIAASYANTATLEPRAESQVVAKTSGVALEVLVEVGQQVRAGQVLVRLDADRARLQAAQSAAQVRKLEANFRRAQQLEAQQMVSANDLDQLRFDLENARAANRLAELELSYTSVVAPISGVIASRDIKPGNFVQINSPIFRIVDSSRLEATLNVPEREIDKLKPGQLVELTADALPGKRFTGTVDRVAPVVDTGTGTFRVVAAFEGGDDLQPGMFSRLAINYDQRADALVMPRTALIEDGGEPSAYAVRDGTVSRVGLALGYSDGAWIEVREGLAEGDAVVVAGKAALREGSNVHVIGGDGGQAVAAQTEQAGPTAQAGN